MTCRSSFPEHSHNTACMPLLQASLRGAIYRSLQHTVICGERWRFNCLLTCSASIYLQVRLLTWLCQMLHCMIC